MLQNTFTYKRLKPLTQVYGVRWLDEDRGWMTLHVEAQSTEEARETVETLLGRNLRFCPIQVLQ